MKLAQHEDAIEFCNRCLFVDPKCIKARVRLADALAAQGEVRLKDPGKVAWWRLGERVRLRDHLCTWVGHCGSEG
eukprot:scaffold4455_cov167-Pinguiococcus_pyrenoidosus.AAC.1